jgi:hypothetical protein
MDDARELDEHESHGDGAGVNPYALTAPEPPQRVTGWHHLPAERWRPDRIRPAAYNDRVRRMPPRKVAALRAGLVKFGFAGTFLVRAEDGLLIGGHRRFEIALALIREYAGDLDQLRRLNLYGTIVGKGRDGYLDGLYGVSLAVSPILGIPDADALALNILLNNREAQGEFEPMGLAEALSALDGAGFDVTDTGFTVEQVESLVTWEPDDTREGGAKAAGAEAPAATVPRGTPQEPANNSGEKPEPARAGAAPLVLPCTRGDIALVLDVLNRGQGLAGLWPVARLIDAERRVAALLDLPASILPIDPPLDFGEPGDVLGDVREAARALDVSAAALPPDVCRRCRLGKWAHTFRSVTVAPGVGLNDFLCADGEPGEFGEVAT